MTGATELTEAPELDTPGVVRLGDGLAGWMSNLRAVAYSHKTRISGPCAAHQKR
jgi:hypothetical protein